MSEKTYLSHTVEECDAKSRYDTEIKKLLSDKTVLSWIMKYSMEEFKDYSIEQIRECIEGEPEVASCRVRPGYTPEAITGMANEDKVPGEGEITYDIKFYVITPDKQKAKIIVNVEAQNKYNPGYDIVTRGVFYCARMLSSQLDKEFTPRNYDDIKKVYSIWICLKIVPKYAEYTMTRYRMKKEDLFGHMPDKNRYDLLETIMICLGRDESRENGNTLHGMLSTLLSQKLTPEEKETILEEEYNFVTSVELKGGIEQMCNLSEGIEQKGIEIGRTEGRIEGRIEGRAEGRAEERENGLKSLVTALKSILPDFESVLAKIKEQDAYADITAEQVRKYY